MIRTAVGPTPIAAPIRSSVEFMDVGIGTEGGREIASLPVVEGEYDREESPRRVWDDYSPPNFRLSRSQRQTYELTSEQYAVNEVRQYVRKIGALEHSGGANWIFSDSTSGGRVPAEVARASGEVDGVRLPKEAYYVCQAMFRDRSAGAHHRPLDLSRRNEENRLSSPPTARRSNCS